jgi:hypothetical protein
MEILLFAPSLAKDTNRFPVTLPSSPDNAVLLTRRLIAAD